MDNQEITQKQIDEAAAQLENFIIAGSKFIIAFTNELVKVMQIYVQSPWYNPSNKDIENELLNLSGFINEHSTNRGNNNY